MPLEGFLMPFKRFKMPQDPQGELQMAPETAVTGFKTALGPPKMAWGAPKRPSYPPKKPPRVKNLIDFSHQKEPCCAKISETTSYQL